MLRATATAFERDPAAAVAGELARNGESLGRRLSEETKAQCTACAFRFDCPECTAYLAGGRTHLDVALGNVFKN